MKKPTDRRILRSHKMLQEALFELVEEKPYSKITVSDITKKANLAKVTFYAHFETKDDLILECFHEITEDYFSSYDNPQNWSIEEKENEKENEKERMIQFFEAWRKNEIILKMIETPYIEMLLSNLFRQRHRQIYADNIAKTRSDVSPVFASYWINFLSSTKLSLLRQWVENDIQQSRQVMGELLHHLCGLHVFIQTLDEFKERMN